MAKKQGPIVDNNRIEQQVWALVQPMAEDCGAELIDVEYVREAGYWYLRLYIDREPPVDLDLCERLSNTVSAALDSRDPIADSYFLEVSSPGLERPLKREADFSRYAGREICLKLYAPQEGKKEFSGLLRGLEAGEIVLERDGGELRFPLPQVAKAHLKYTAGD